MPSFTSNSNNNGWGKSWLLGLIIALVLLGGLEYFWRISGHHPAIVDDQRSWAMERSKAGTSDKEIALLGSSRMQSDISMATMRRILPGYSIINLPIDGTCANATLHDLADDDKFSGTVIMETTSECLMFGDNRKVSQKSFVDYYHRVYNLNAKINRLMATLLQKNLTIIDPYLNLIKVAGDVIRKKQWREPNYVITYEDRSRTNDYTKVDIGKHVTERLKHQEILYRRLAPSISTQHLVRQLKSIDADVRKITNRGGKVFFVRFPVSDEHWTIDEQYFPRDKYWNAIAPLTEAQLLHFKDVDIINKLKCPDTSHLDYRDTEIFTIQLLKVLFPKKIN